MEATLTAYLIVLVVLFIRTYFLGAIYMILIVVPYPASMTLSTVTHEVRPLKLQKSYLPLLHLLD